MISTLKDQLTSIAVDAVRRDTADTLVSLRARIAKLERSNAELAKANLLLRYLVAADDK